MSGWFAGLIKDARTEAEQSVEAMAMMVNVAPEEYLEYEQGKIPPVETLQKICQLLEWNYNDILRGIRTQATLAKDIGNKSALTQASSEASPKSSLSSPSDISLGKMMCRAREAVGATPDSVALLLNISQVDLNQLESDTIVPGEELLKKISTVFEWNYNELFQLLKRKSISGLDFSAKAPPHQSSVKQLTIKALCQQITEQCDHVEEKTLLVIEAQLDLIAATLRKFQA